MKFVVTRSDATGEIRFSGSFTDAEVAKLRFDRLDRAVLSAPHTSAADMLLDLELIYRRHQEQIP